MTFEEIPQETSMLQMIVVMWSVLDTAKGLLVDFLIWVVCTTSYVIKKNFEVVTEMSFYGVTCFSFHEKVDFLDYISVFLARFSQKDEDSVNKEIHHFYVVRVLQKIDISHY